MGAIVDTLRAAELRISNFFKGSTIADPPLPPPVRAYSNDGLVLSTTGKPLPSFPGFRAGDALDIDGPLWANGTGRIVAMDANRLELQFTVKDPTDLPGIRKLVNNPYIRKDGKVSISLRVERLDDGKVRASTVDLNDGKSTGSSVGTISELNKGGKKQYLIRTPDLNITITLTGPGKMNVELSALPVGSFDISKK